ncbi:MAG: anti-sigma factor antagonist [Chloroflexaceae bacterium]|nr:anti-sigma factor antagonist [Chloroflexaceae bacterium]
MEIQTQQVDAIEVVTVQGDIDSKTAPAFQEALLPFYASNDDLVLNMSQVTFMSSAGLRVLLSVYRQASQASTRLVLVGLSEELQDTMSATGFLEHFETYTTLDEGIAAIKQKA